MQTRDLTDADLETVTGGKQSVVSRTKTDSAGESFRPSRLEAAAPAAAAAPASPSCPGGVCRRA